MSKLKRIDAKSSRCKNDIVKDVVMRFYRMTYINYSLECSVKTKLSATNSTYKTKKRNITEGFFFFF
jgi:hypothetical protein